MLRQKAFATIEGKGPKRLPVLFSAPHVGLVIPEDIKQSIKEEFHDFQPDADHLVHRLYQPLTQQGCDLIHAVFSRYVIDLNRGLDQTPLYDDQKRSQTGLIPEKTFAGEPIYREGASKGNVNERLPYYESYHAEISRRLKALKKDYSAGVLLIDTHSIPRQVPWVRKDPLADITLGDNKGQSCDSKIVQVIEEEFKKGGFSVARNDPFQGGYITRHYGKPQDGINALQIELSQDMYLVNQFRIDAAKSDQYRACLVKAFERIFSD